MWHLVVRAATAWARRGAVLRSDRPAFVTQRELRRLEDAGRDERNRREMRSRTTPRASVPESAILEIPPARVGGPLITSRVPRSVPGVSSRSRSHRRVGCPPGSIRLEPRRVRGNQNT